MKKIENHVEKNLVRVIIFFMIITAIFVHLNYSYASSEIIIWGLSFSNITLIFGLAISFFCTWFGREKLFHFVLNHIPSLIPKHGLSKGTWTIHIKFTDTVEGNEEEKERTGHVHMSASLVGMRITGGKLLNTKDQSVTMNNWFAENAELITYGNTEILYYIYKIPSTNSWSNQQAEIQFEKIGFVYAIKEDRKDSFVGFFEDIRIENGSNKTCHRRGEITLVKDTISS